MFSQVFWLCSWGGGGGRGGRDGTTYDEEK